MKPAVARGVGWGLLLISLALAITGNALYQIGQKASGGGPISVPVPPYFTITMLLLITAYSAVGALIVSRHPGHPIGWIYCALGVNSGLVRFITGYSIYGHFAAEPASILGAEIVYWLESWIWIPGLWVGATFPVLLFPDGRLPSRRWRPLAWTVALGTIGASAGSALLPGGIESAGGLPWGMFIAGAVMLMVGLVGSVASVFVRFRLATGVEREQLKWLVYGGAAELGILTIPYGVGYLWHGVLLGDVVGVTVIRIALASLPVAVGIAILRYRLYEIDIIIRRTLIYGALTATLAGAYLVSVLALQAAFRRLTGQGDQLAIVASTLGIAALFVPVRRRIQKGIDRRFYRSKYDAEKVLAAFGATVREEVDLERLSGKLLAAVQETMHPAHASLWLAASGGMRGGLDERGGPALK